MNTTDPAIQAEIRLLQDRKVQLLNIYGVFGGGARVNEMFEDINKRLEALGVDPNS